MTTRLSAMKFVRSYGILLSSIAALVLTITVLAFVDLPQESTPPFLLRTNMTRIRSTPILSIMAFNTYFHYELQAGEFEELIDQDELSNQVDAAVRAARENFTGNIFAGDRRSLEAFMDEALKADFVLKQKGIIVEKVIVVN